MTMMNFARTAYGQPQAPLRSPRSLEYDLLARVTRRLRSGWEGRKTDFPALAAAIADNRQVWSTLALDVANCLHATLPMGAVARETYKQMRAKGRGKQDWTAVLEHMREMSGLESGLKSGIPKQ